MADFTPSFKLYNSGDGGLLRYTFIAVQYTNAPQTTGKHVEIKGQRGIGSIIIDGGTDTWELIIRGILYNEGDDDYQDLTVDIDALEAAVVYNTPYLLRIEKTALTYYEYKVKRVKSITYSESFRTDFQEYEIKLLVNTW